MRRNQTFHETLIPLLVEGLGVDTYLEFGTHLGETISKVRCRRRIGVDANIWLDGDFDFYKMTTAKFIEKHAARLAPFDFVFIDADHSAAAAEADFNGIYEYVSPDGIICLHDTNPETAADTDPGFCGDSWRFAMSLWNDNYEAVTLPYHPGLTIFRKRAFWGPE